MWFHLHTVQKQAKTIYVGYSQDYSSLLGNRFWKGVWEELRGCYNVIIFYFLVWIPSAETWTACEISVNCAYAWALFQCKWFAFSKLNTCFSASPTAILNLSCKSLQKGAFLSKSKLREHFSFFVLFFPKIWVHAMTLFCFSSGPSGNMGMHGHPILPHTPVHVSAAVFLRGSQGFVPFLWPHFQETPKQERVEGAGGLLLIFQKIIWD